MTIRRSIAGVQWTFFDASDFRAMNHPSNFSEACDEARIDALLAFGHLAYGRLFVLMGRFLLLQPPEKGSLAF